MDRGPLVAYLRHAGQPTTVAATISGLLGVLSVTSRLATNGLAGRHDMTTVTAAVFAIQAASAPALPYVAGSLAWVAVRITAFGLGFGVATIARPAILAHRYGTHRDATIAAAMNLPIILARAAGPLAAQRSASTISPFTAAACLLAAALLRAARKD